MLTLRAKPISVVLSLRVSPGLRGSPLMFRRPVIVVPGRTETQYVTREVRGHRAPTDESVKLLKEFEDAADERRVKTLHLNGNAFTGRIFVDRIEYAGERRARCVFDLNGARITVDHTTHWDEDQQTLLTALRDKIAVRIANEILASAMSVGTAETEGLRAKPASATRKGDAQ